MTTLQTLPSDSFVADAFKELLTDVTNLIESTKAQKPLDKDELKFWRSQFNALNKAAYHWTQGARPVVSGDAYLIPSASRPGALIHRLTKVGGIVVCSCEAGQRGILCFHHMLINVIERAAELESLAQKTEEISGGSEPTPIPHPLPPIPHAAKAAAWLTLQTRLAVTAQYVATLRSEQQQRTPDEAPTRRHGMRLVQARRKSAYFASAFYLAA